MLPAMRVQAWSLHQPIPVHGPSPGTVKPVQFQPGACCPSCQKIEGAPRPAWGDPSTTPPPLRVRLPLIAAPYDPIFGSGSRLMIARSAAACVSRVRAIDARDDV